MWASTRGVRPPPPVGPDTFDLARRWKSEGVVLWIRSGTTYGGPTVDSVKKVLESEEAARARVFGTRLVECLGSAACAPGDLSVLTARAILEGAGGGATEAILEDPSVGDPSAFIRDFEACKASYSGRGFSKEQARDHLLDGVLRTHAAWACEDPRQAALVIQDRLVSMIQPGKIGLCVSPSVAIALYAACALGLEQSISHKDCPGFLDGAVVWRGDGGKVNVQLGSHAGVSTL